MKTLPDFWHNEGSALGTGKSCDSVSIPSSAVLEDSTSHFCESLSVFTFRVSSGEEEEEISDDRSWQRKSSYSISSYGASVWGSPDDSLSIKNHSNIPNNCLIECDNKD